MATTLEATTTAGTRSYIVSKLSEALALPVEQLQSLNEPIRRRTVWNVRRSRILNRLKNQSAATIGQSNTH